MRQSQNYWPCCPLIFCLNLNNCQIFMANVAYMRGMFLSPYRLHLEWIFDSCLNKNKKRKDNIASKSDFSFLSSSPWIYQISSLNDKYTMKKSFVPHTDFDGCVKINKSERTTRPIILGLNIVPVLVEFAFSMSSWHFRHHGKVGSYSDTNR